MKGFSLVEIVIYLAIIALVAVAFIGFSISLYQARAKAYSAQEVQANLRFLTDFLGQKIKESNGVLLPEPGESSDVLSLSFSEPASDLSFFVEGGLVWVSDESGQVFALTTPQIEISQFHWANLSSPGQRPNLYFSTTAGHGDQESGSFFRQSLNTSWTLRK